MKDKTANQLGFTLIELSIVMTVLSLLLVGAIQTYSLYEAKVKHERMNTLMVTLDQTIAAYYKSEGRFPCPAPLNGGAAGNDFDSESCASGVLNVAGAGSGRVLIGKIPAATLGLSNDYMRDIYGSYITYVVTQGATVDGGSIAGAIRVREENVDRAVGSSTYGQIVELENHTNITYLILSAGKSRAGAYNHDGVQQVACSGTAKERENCNGDGIFISSLLSDAGTTDAVTFYDDRVAFKKDDDISAAEVRALRIAKEGEDYERRTKFDGTEEYVMKKDGYMIAESSMSDASPNDMNSYSRKMLELSEGDIISHNYPFPTLSSGTARLEDGRLVYLGGFDQAGSVAINGEWKYGSAGFYEGSTETTEDNFVFSSKYNDNPAPQISRRTSYRSPGREEYPRSNEYSGQIWVE